MNRLPKSPSPFNGLRNCFIAGGAILSAVTKTEPADYDIYPKTREAISDILYYLLEDENCFVLNVSDRAITLKSNENVNVNGERIVIQVMIFDTFDTPEKIFEFFDFTVCMAAFDTDTNQYEFHPDFFPDVASKTIRFNPKTRYPLNSMMRIGKYRKKGYTLPTSEMIRMSLTLMQSQLPTCWEDLENAIGGTYGAQIKLHTDNLEFSIENAMKFFDELDVDLLGSEQVRDWSSLTADDFEDIFGEIEFRKYTVACGDTIFVSKTGKILKSSGTSIILELCEILGVTIEDADPSTVITGWKTLKQNKDGQLVNNTYYGKTFVYKIDEVVEEPNSPHLFVYTSLPASVTKPWQVEFKLEDIATVETNGVVTVKKLKVLPKDS